MPTIRTKTQLYAAIAALPAPITRASLVALLDDMVASWEDYIQSYTSAQRDVLTPTTGDIIYNTDMDRVEVFEAAEWVAMSSTEQTLIDCSANPNYPEGAVNDIYFVTVAGKIGGASGKDVYVGDLIICVALNGGGTEASVGGSWKVVHSASSSDVPTYYAEITLSSAQILALNGTPQTLVAAPGAGKIIVPEEVIVNYTHVTTAYNAQNTSIKYAGGATALSNITDTLDTYSASQIAITQPSAVGASKWYANSILQVWASANPTTGNGTMTVGVYYKIHTL